MDGFEVACEQLSVAVSFCFSNAQMAALLRGIGLFAIFAAALSQLALLLLLLSFCVGLIPSEN